MFFDTELVEVEKYVTRVSAHEVAPEAGVARAAVRLNSYSGGIARADPQRVVLDGEVEGTREEGDVPSSPNISSINWWSLSDESRAFNDVG